eukprot:1159535-Pelagomonas_calceolata.AAC.3
MQAGGGTAGFPQSEWKMLMGWESGGDACCSCVCYEWSMLSWQCRFIETAKESCIPGSAQKRITSRSGLQMAVDYKWQSFINGSGLQVAAVYKWQLPMTYCFAQLAEATAVWTHFPKFLSFSVFTNLGAVPASGLTVAGVADLPALQVCKSNKTIVSPKESCNLGIWATNTSSDAIESDAKAWRPYLEAAVKPRDCTKTQCRVSIYIFTKIPPDQSDTPVAGALEICALCDNRSQVVLVVGSKELVACRGERGGACFTVSGGHMHSAQCP